MARKNSDPTLSDLLVKAGLGTWQLAQAARCGHETIADALAGRRKLQIRTAVKIAKALGCSTEQVMDALERSRAVAAE